MKTKVNISNRTFLKILGFVLLGIIIITCTFQFIRPLISYDIWFHMSYGKYMIENSTLIPDHYLYTWSVIPKDTIYCAWLAEILLYLIYSFGGLTALFALRFLTVFLFIFLCYYYAYKRKIFFHPFTALVTFIGISIFSFSILLKPEIFTHIYICLIVAVWWFIKHDPDKNWKFCYCFPIIMLLWINSHGGFIFGYPFLGLVFIGELINRYFSKEQALPAHVLKHLFISLIITAFTIFMTPYGWKYPLDLINIFSMDIIKDIRMYKFVAYFSPFTGQLNLFVIYFVIMVFILLIQITNIFLKKKIDWDVILPVLFYGWLYTQFFRTTLYFVPIFAFSSIYMFSGSQSERQNGLRLKFLVTIVIPAVIVLSYSLFLCYEYFNPPLFRQAWVGFGIGYQHPVQEGKLIKKFFPDIKRIGNTYNNGSYLLWKLSPEKKTFIDTRYFPFEKIIKYYNFLNNAKHMDKFLNKFPADLWCLEFNEHLKNTRWFINSDDWKLAFYGARAKVFVKKHVEIPEELKKIRIDEIANIRCLKQALLVLDFATDVFDWESAKIVLDGIEKNFKYNRVDRVVNLARHFYEGKKAYYQRDYQNAVSNLEKCKRTVYNSDIHLVAGYHHLAVKEWTDNNNTRALEITGKALEIDPKNLYGLFNRGVIKWWIARNDTKDENEKTKSKDSWKDSLKEFIRLTKNKPAAKEAVQIAAKIITDTYRGNRKPPLLYPPEPTAMIKPK